MAVASGSIKSTLNPNAPLFVPAAFQQVEDFSPEWWELVKTTTWFRDYWFHEHQEQETFNGYYDEEDDIANLLPDSFDLGIVDDFLSSDPHPNEEEALRQQSEAHRALAMSDDHRLPKSGLESEAERLIRNLSLKSPRNTSLGYTKQWEKPAQAFSPRSAPRRIIQQPR